MLWLLTMSVRFSFSPPIFWPIHCFQHTPFRIGGSRWLHEPTPTLSAHSPDCKGREGPDTQSLPSPELPDPSWRLNYRNQGVIIIYSTYQPLPNPTVGLLNTSTIQALASATMLLQRKVTALWDFCNSTLFLVFFPSCPSSFSTRTKKPNTESR